MDRLPGQSLWLTLFVTDGYTCGVLIGLILDCGGGRRRVYLDNIVNFEIVVYDTTDVRGVGEMLPLLRVLKPDDDLMTY